MGEMSIRRRTDVPASFKREFASVPHGDELDSLPDGKLIFTARSDRCLRRCDTPPALEGQPDPTYRTKKSAATTRQA